MKKPLERDIQKQILEWLNLWGAFAVRTNSGAFVGEHKGKKRFVRFTNRKGCSDILAVLLDGRFMACEVKRPGEKPTDDQRQFLRDVEHRGGLGLWVTSLDQLRSDLREAGYKA